MNAMAIKFPDGFIAETDKLILRFIGKYTGSKIAKTILKKKNKVEGLIPISKLSTKLH